MNPVNGNPTPECSRRRNCGIIYNFLHRHFVVTIFNLPMQLPNLYMLQV